MPTLASVLLLCHLPVAVTPPPTVRIDLVFKGLPIKPRLEAVAMKEVRKIWAEYGVDVQAPAQENAAREGALRLPVVLVGSADPGARADRLGSIDFVGDVPRPAIALYPNAITTLLSNAERLNGGDPELSAFHDLTLGRIFGRALAHEIGHYLLRSREHSATGLMQARWKAADLISRDTRRFALTSGDLSRFESLISAVSCAGAGQP